MEDALINYCLCSVGSLLTLTVTSNFFKSSALVVAIVQQSVVQNQPERTNCNYYYGQK